MQSICIRSVNSIFRLNEEGSKIASQKNETTTITKQKQGAGAWGLWLGGRTHPNSTERKKDKSQSGHMPVAEGSPGLVNKILA